MSDKIDSDQEIDDFEDPPDFDDWVECVQGTVAYCATCQPYDTGECVWILGVETDWNDILDNCDVAEKYRERVAGQIACPRCGASLDITCPVGVKSAQELAVEELWNRWYEEYHYRFDEFYEFLEKHPYLGLAHELGAELHERVESLPQCTLKDEVWYRARRVNRSKLLTVRDMYPPDPAEVEIPEGRYNHFGQCVFYLAEEKEGAAQEALGDEGGLAWVQAFRLRKIKRILDLAPYKHHGEPDPKIDLLTFVDSPH